MSGYQLQSVTSYKIYVYEVILEYIYHNKWASVLKIMCMTEHHTVTTTQPEQQFRVKVDEDCSVVTIQAKSLSVFLYRKSNLD